MNEEKKLTIPEGYEFDKVENGEVILKKKEIAMPKTWEECMDDHQPRTLLPRLRGVGRENPEL